MTHLTELVGTTLSGQAKAAIRHAILTEYEPGQRLNEVEISAALGISRGPVRESIRALAGEGLLELVPHRGPMVKKLSHDEFRQLYEVRRALEGFGAMLAASRASVSDIARLRRVVEEVHEMGHGFFGVGAPEFDFHLNLLQIARSEQLMAITTDVNTRLWVARTRSGIIPVRAHEAHGEHVAIVDAIEAGDPAGAERLMREHLEQSQGHAESVLEESLGKNGNTQID